jgi:serine/threonine protein kinase
MQPGTSAPESGRWCRICRTCRGWRVGDGGNRGVVLLVLVSAEYPSPSSLDRLAHEHGLKDELDGAWAVRPLEFVREGGQVVLVLEDAGGEPLDRLLGTPMEVGLFLRLAIGMAMALGKLHQRGLVHKDIKPANIMVKCADNQVRLTGFGLASRLPRERQPPDPPEFIARTLAFVRNISSAFSRLFTPRNPAGWGWGCRSLGRSSMPMGVDYGQRPNEPRGAVFQFTLPSGQETHEPSWAGSPEWRAS